MKLRYYLSGLGSGIIIAVLIMLIADKVTAVKMCIRDSGNGIDIERVKAKAVEKGTVTQEQADAMTEKEAIDLLFRPSFSTSEKITDVSGRGVGLDVVKSKIEALGGDVEVKTKYGEGSTFSIRLPLTLAIIQALMVKLGDEKYAISLGAIETIEDVPVTDIKYIHAKEVINLRGSVIPLIRLRDILDVPGEQEESDTITVVIVRKGDKDVYKRQEVESNVELQSVGMVTA